jgi:(1->4)-alpha-D-glucan 1-alpha-D-glucosylmutase
MLKASREAKIHTSWINQNEAYEAALQKFVKAVLADSPKNPFLKDFAVLRRRVAFYGRLNALAQLLLKMTSPGIPDFYQGRELWDYSLVDPDNRRPIDYEHRRTVLAELKKQMGEAGQNPASFAAELLASAHDGRVKLYLIYMVLNFRRIHADLFSRGDYIPLQAIGEKQDHVCAFKRKWGKDEIIIVVPRLVMRLTGGIERAPLGETVWQDTWLALPSDQSGQDYRDLFTGETVSTSEYGDRVGLSLSIIFRSFPMALLERRPDTRSL